MSIQLQIISGERCDHCDKADDRPIVALKHRSMEYGRIQIWLHLDCLAKLGQKAERMIERDSGNVS